MIALVVVDHDQPHLDQAFEYAIPPELENLVQLGQAVKVNFGRQKLRGWVVGFRQKPSFTGKLSTLLAIESSLPLFDAALLKTCKYLATRFGANLSQVLSLALPTVNQKAEAEVFASIEEKQASEPQSELTSTHSAPNVNRVVRTVLPGERPSLLAGVARQALAKAGSLVVVVPTARDVELVRDELAADFPEKIFCLHPTMKSKERYKLHLQAKLGLARIVVGTRSAVWLPLQKPLSMVVWDDADDRLREQRFPYIDTVDAAVARSFIEHISVMFAAYSRSIKTEQLVQTKWAIDTTPAKEVIRRFAPRVAIFDSAEAEKEGVVGRMLLPDKAFLAIRQGLETGSVLCQVLSAGWVKYVSCKKCAITPKCPLCDKEIIKPVEANVWACESGHNLELVCQNCGGKKFIAPHSGAEQIAAELQAALPNTKVVVSASSTQVLRTISAEPVIVVSTPGAEPVVAPTIDQPAGLGYATVVVTEASASAFRSEFGALLEAGRRFFNALALARPRATCLVIGEVPLELEQAFTLWDPRIIAKTDLADRQELGFFPSKWMVAIDGEKPVVSDFKNIVFGTKTLHELTRKKTQKNTHNTHKEPILNDLSLTKTVSSLELVGEFLLSEAESTRWRCLVRCDPAEATILMRGLRQIVRQLSKCSKPYPLLEVNPIQITVK